MSWIWNHPSFPDFSWNSDQLAPLLATAHQLKSKLLTVCQFISPEEGELLSSDILAEEMITTSEIEGEILNRSSVRSSIAHRLGIEQAGLNGPKDRYVDGLLDMLLDAADLSQPKLTEARLKSWHAALFPTGYSGINKIQVAEYRDSGDMQIISGRPGKITCHYLAPPHTQINTMMKGFLNWFNNQNKQINQIDGIVKAGLAHIWFEIIHPFDDGNGRLGRAIIEMILAQLDQTDKRFYSISQQIMSARKEYYLELGHVSSGRSEMDITGYLKWFISIYQSAIQLSLDKIEKVLFKSKFWQKHRSSQLNARQIKVLNKLLDIGLGLFEGGMTTRKYQSLTGVSRATAYRELQDLVNKNCLKPLPAQGRSSGYELNSLKI